MHTQEQIDFMIGVSLKKLAGTVNNHRFIWASYFSRAIASPVYARYPERWDELFNEFIGDRFPEMSPIMSSDDTSPQVDNLGLTFYTYLMWLTHQALVRSLDYEETEQYAFTLFKILVVSPSNLIASPYSSIYINSSEVSTFLDALLSRYGEEKMKEWFSLLPEGVLSAMTQVDADIIYEWLLRKKFLGDYDELFALFMRTSSNLAKIMYNKPSEFPDHPESLKLFCSSVTASMSLFEPTDSRKHPSLGFSTRPLSTPYYQISLRNDESIEENFFQPSDATSTLTSYFRALVTLKDQYDVNIEESDFYLPLPLDEPHHEVDNPMPWLCPPIPLPSISARWWYLLATYRPRFVASFVRFTSGSEYKGYRFLAFNSLALAKQWSYMTPFIRKVAKDVGPRKYYNNLSWIMGEFEPKSFDVLDYYQYYSMYLNYSLYSYFVNVDNFDVDWLLYVQSIFEYSNSTDQNPKKCLMYQACLYALIKRLSTQDVLSYVELMMFRRQYESARILLFTYLGNSDLILTEQEAQQAFDLTSRIIDSEYSYQYLSYHEILTNALMRSL